MSFVLSVYVPSLLFAIGQGVVIPFIPLIARVLNSSVSMAASIESMRGLGMVLFNMPAGFLVTRLGERTAMLLGTGVLVLVAFAASLVNTSAQFAVVLFVMGCAWSVWQLARQSFVCEHTDKNMRGHVVSYIAAIFRLGAIIGPFLGTLLSHYWGFTSCFYLQAGACVIGSAVLCVAIPDDSSDVEPPSDTTICSVLVAHQRVLLTAGLASLCLTTMRASRLVIVDLWGTSLLGLSIEHVGLLIGISNALELVLLYPAGWLSDKRGRLAVAIPCMLFFTIGLTMTVFSSTTLLFWISTLISSVGNGLGSGIIMTIGIDLAPPDKRAEFLAIWRTLTDAGLLIGPALLGFVTSTVSFPAGVASIAITGILGLVILLLFVHETRPKEKEVHEISEVESLLEVTSSVQTR